MAKIEYYVIHRWMREELHLEDTELHCYAVIYGLSQGDNWYNAGVKNIMDILGKSEPTVISALKSLTEKNLVVKVPVVLDNAKKNFYKSTRCMDEATLNNLSNPTLNNLSNPTLNNLSTTKLNNIKVNKRLSNDNPKVQDALFETFWEAYGYKRKKENAIKAWGRLTKKEKEEAIKCISIYKSDCAKSDRSMQYPSTYLNQKTWNDDFDSCGKVGCYDILPEDDEKVRRFKKWMREKHTEIEFTEVPLTFDGYMRLQREYGMEEVCNQLDYIDANIGKFRRSDIEKTIRQFFEHL